MNEVAITLTGSELSAQEISTELLRTGQCDNQTDADNMAEAIIEALAGYPTYQAVVGSTSNIRRETLK